MRYVIISIVLAALSSGAWTDEPLIGFFKSSEADQLAGESTYLKVPTPDAARRWLRRLTEEPHVAGTAQEKRLADFVLETLKSFGLDTEVVKYDVYLNYPEEVSLELTEPLHRELRLRELAYPTDKDSTQLGMFPAFHGYAASGTVTEQVVYVNYGTPEDYKQLEELDVSVEGKIALARYGKVFRGLKVKQAQEHGAIGALIYSDPADDGYMKGDVYPDGPMRPASGIQRGSVQFLSIQPGDPSTPGYPSTKKAKRVARDKMTTLPRIPSLPIGYGAAREILKRLGGPRVPDEWQGGLPFSYHVGPGGAAVKMSVKMEGGLRPIYNVFARIHGTDEDEKLVILGNHRDAWNHGAVDPNSGTAVLLETARGLAAAIKAGWKPKRTIVLANWDAEEYGLVGSTEWGEDNAENLRAKAVAYINLDSSVTGDEFGVGASPSLRDLAVQIADSLDEPKKGGTLRASWEALAFSDWKESEPVPLSGPDATFRLRVSPLGSGSDYTVFIDHLGIPSLNFRFSGPFGVYHSVYDNFRWMDLYGDPGFIYHAVAAKFYGLMAMRLASADIVPLRYAHYADALGQNLDELRRNTIRDARALAREDSEETEPLNPDFGPLISALGRFEQAGKNADAAADAVIGTQDGARARRINALLIPVERAFLSEEGLPPNRPWFKNVIYAPGTTTGYASWPFPGPRQALVDNDADAFLHELDKVVAALDEASKRLNAVAQSAQ